MTTTAIRNQYTSLGVSAYYETYKDSYINPHASQALDCLDELWQPQWTSALDLACGEGLVSKFLSSKGIHSLYGCDKYMADRYTKETGNVCYRQGFEEIACFTCELPTVDAVVISYALDLVEASYLPNLLLALSMIASNLIVIRPNNHVIDHFSWQLAQRSRSGKARGVWYKAN